MMCMIYDQDFLLINSLEKLTSFTVGYFHVLLRTEAGKLSGEWYNTSAVDVTSWYMYKLLLISLTDYMGIIRKLIKWFEQPRILEILMCLSYY